jgi:hypothetical protein
MKWRGNIMKVNLLSKQNVVLRDADVFEDDDDDNDLVLSDTPVSLVDWGHLRTGTLKFPLHRSLELSSEYIIEFENGDRKEIAFTRLQANGEYLRVGFKIKNIA